MIAKAEVSIGTYTSNFLKYAYEMKSVDNQFASEHVFSLDWPDYVFFNFQPTSTFADCRFMFENIPTENELIMAATKKKVSEFCAMDCDERGCKVKEHFVKISTNMEQIARNGFHKIKFYDPELYGNKMFWVPFYALRNYVPPIS